MRTATFCPSSVTRSVFFSFGPSFSACVCSQPTGAVGHDLAAHLARDGEHAVGRNNRLIEVILVDDPEQHAGVAARGIGRRLRHGDGHASVEIGECCVPAFQRAVCVPTCGVNTASAAFGWNCASGSPHALSPVWKSPEICADAPVQAKAGVRRVQQGQSDKRGAFACRSSAAGGDSSATTVCRRKRRRMAFKTRF